MRVVVISRSFIVTIIDFSQNSRELQDRCQIPDFNRLWAQNANANNAAGNGNNNQGGDNQPVMFPQPAQYYANQLQQVQAAIQCFVPYSCVYYIAFLCI